MREAVFTTADAQVAGGLSETASEGIIDSPQADAVCRPAVQSSRRWERELATLIRQVALGDRNALLRLYDETGSLVYGLALRWMDDQSAAEQVTMEVYEKIHRSGISIFLDNKEPLAWLLCLTYRQMEPHLNREGSIEAQSGQNLTTGKKITLTKASCRGVAFTSALLALTSEERIVVELACHTGLTLAEIAAGLDWSVERVRTRLGTGMTRLRAELRHLTEQVHYDSRALD